MLLIGVGDLKGDTSHRNLQQKW